MDRYRSRFSNYGIKIPAAVLAGIFIILASYAYVELLIASFEHDRSPTLSHYVTAIETGYLLWQPLLNSMIVCIATGILATGAGTILAWLVVRTDMPGRRWIPLLVTLPQVIPSFQLASSWIVTFTHNGVFQAVFGVVSPLPAFGALPLIIVQSIHVVLFSFLAVVGALAALDPTLEEAGEVVGLRRSSIMRRITLPLVLPAIISGFLLTFANCIESLGAPLLLGTPSGFQVLTTQIYELATSPPVEFGQASVLSVLLGLTAIAVLMLNLRLLARGSYVTVTGKAGSQGIRLALQAWKWPVAVLVWIFLLIIGLVPMMALLLVSMLKSWGRGFGPGNLTISHFAALAQGGQVGAALVNSLTLGAATGVLSTLFGLVVAYGTVRHKAHWAAAVDRFSFLAYATPGLVVGLGFILAFSHWPINLYNTYWMLLGAYFVRFAGVGVRTVTAKLVQLSPELEEAGEVAGLSRIRVLFAISLPLLRQGLMTTGILTFIAVVKEISATSILAGQNVQTLSYVAFLRYTEGDYTTGSAISVIMIVIALAGTAAIALWSRIGSAKAST